MQTIQLPVPQNAHLGFLIQAQVNGQTIQAQVPPGLQPGATFSVQVLAASVDDPAATAAYDALLARASRLTFSSKHEHANEPEFDTGPWSVEADTGATFEVTFDGPSKTSGHGDGSYNAQVMMSDVVVQRFSSTGLATGESYMAAHYRCPHPPASQSMDRGEALTVQVKRTNREEVVHLTRGGGGGLSLVGPPAPPEPVCCACCAGAPANYVAYDRAGAPLGGAQLGIPAWISCDGGGDPRLQRLWLDLGSTPVAARRDLVAAVVTTLVGHWLTPSVVPHSNT